MEPDQDQPLQPADNVVNFILGQQRQARLGAMQPMVESPDDAQRAMELSRASGADPTLVATDLEGFENRQKAAFTDEILKNNKYLMDYANSHPMAPSLSNGDWGNLDKFSQSLQQYSGLNTLEHAAKDFAEGFGREGPFFTSRYIAEGHPNVTMAGEAMALDLLTGVGQLAFRAPGGLINAAAQYMRRSYERITGESGEEVTNNFLQFISDPGVLASLGPLAPEAEAVTSGIRAKMAEIKRAAPYVKAGELPPPGVSEAIDKARMEDNRDWLKGLKQQERDANATNKINGDAEDFRAFVNQHKPEHIELQADAVRSIYGDEPIMPGDGRFGDIPGFNEELALAERHNGHVQVPLADWFLFANQNPEEAKFLQKFASRPGGITQEEGERLGEFHKAQAEAEAAIEEPKPEEGEEPKAVAAPEASPHEAAIAAVRRGAGFGSPDAIQPIGGIIPDTAIRQTIQTDEGPVEAKAFFAKDAIKMIDKERLTGVPRALAEFFHDRLDRLAGDGPIWVVPTQDMPKINSLLGTKPLTPGFYLPEADAIVLRNDHAAGYGGHDVATHLLIHELTHRATYNEMEANGSLKTMVRALMREADQSLSLNTPQDRKVHAYAFKNEHEFMAEAFSNPRFQEVLSTIPASEELVAGLGLKENKSVWDAVKEMVRQVLTKLIGFEPPPTIMDGVMKVGEAIEETRQAARRGGKALGAEPREPELPGITRMESRAAFKTPGAAGLSADALRRYMGLIEKQNEADTKFIQDKALEDERKRQTAEWKENEKRVKSDVRSAIYQRSVIVADRYFREGIIDGRKAGNFKLDSALLTDEQKRSLDPEYYGRDGGSPDDMAGVFGYQSGDALIQALAGLKAERDLEGLTPQAHISKMVNVAAEHEMQRQYGDLEENILREAKEHVFSPSQIDILADETIHLASLAGSELPISKEDMMKGAKQVFDAAPLRAVDSKAFETSAARAGQAVQDALLKGDARAALKAKQEQTNAAIYANLALKFEKKLKRFQDIDAPRWGRREPPGVPQEDAVWMHQILLQVLGPEGIQTSRQDLERRKEMSSPYQNLREYVEAKNKAKGTASTDPNNPTTGQSLTVLPDLFSANWPGKAFDGLSTTEFQGVYDSLKSINHYGHEQNKYTVKGNKEDLARVVDGLIERLKAAVDNKPAVEQAHETSGFRNIGTLLLNTETWMNRLDLGNRQGPFNQLIMRPITEGQYELRQFEKDFAAKWKDLGDFPDFNKKINNNLFRDSEGDWLKMTKGNAYAVLANMGNALQRRKMVQGWGLSKDFDVGEQMIWNWLANVAGMGPEDLARAQKMGKIFSDAFELAEKSWVHVAGVAPARIELYKVRTPWGDADEWYHPLIPDPLHHQGLSAEDMINEGQGYWRPSPASGYTKTRTGAVYPIDLSFNSAAFRLKQVLNDAAMRIPITEVSKIVYNKKFQAAFKKYYGPEYHSALDSWMKDAAGNRQWQSTNMQAVDRFVTALSQNLSTSYIGFSPTTVMKHGLTAAVFSASEVGFKNWANSMMAIIKEIPGSNETWNWAFENSEEIRNRMNHIEDTLANQNRNLFTIEQNRAFDKTRRRISSFRDSVNYYGHFPVGFADLISAVSMFHAEYQRMSELHPDMSHGDLVYAANTAVRRTHGSSILTNRAAIMRSSPFVRLITPFYNFMNNALQRNYELAWKAKLAMQGRELPEMTGFDKETFEAGMQHIPSIIGGVAVYGLTLGLVAWMVNRVTGNAPPQRSDESSASYWGKVLASGYADQVPAVRDVFNSVVEGHDPSIGLYGSAAREVTKPLSFKEWNLRQNPGKTLKTALDAIGVASGLTTQPANRLAEYVTNVLAGKEHPKGFGDLITGGLHGTQNFRRR